MPTNDIKHIAGAAGANVLTQAEYEALVTILANGMSAGVVPSKQLNKMLRQSSLVAAAVAQFIADNQPANVVDDGDVAALTAKILAAIQGAPGVTRALGTNTTQNATTAFVLAEIINQFTKAEQQLFAAAGYQKFPGGLIMQWGSIARNGASANGSTTFPVAFPANVYNVQLTDSAVPGNSSVVWAVDTPTLTGFTGFFTASGVAGTTNRVANYIAIGR